jgi:hypothetical protein
MTIACKLTTVRVQCTDPHTALLADLQIFILQRQALEDIIIVGIDANEDVRGRTIKPFFAELQMHDAIS